MNRRGNSLVGGRVGNSLVGRSGTSAKTLKGAGGRRVRRGRGGVDEIPHTSGQGVDRIPHTSGQNSLLYPHTSGQGVDEIPHTSGQGVDKAANSFSQGPQETLSQNKNSASRPELPQSMNSEKNVLFRIEVEKRKPGIMPQYETRDVRVYPDYLEYGDDDKKMVYGQLYYEDIMHHQGSMSNGKKYFELRLKPEKTRSHSNRNKTSLFKPSLIYTFRNVDGDEDNFATWRTTVETQIAAKREELAARAREAMSRNNKAV